VLDSRIYSSQIPEFARIPTVDELDNAIAELAGRYARLCRLRAVGAARSGYPLRMLSIGAGRRHALVLGGPHPNEPVGFLTVLELARLVAAHPDLREGLGYTWHFIPCIDPDGARLNEGWYGGPFALRHYHRHFYRPARYEQPEWTFPAPGERAPLDRTLPETEALMRVIDELRPQFLYSLHNSDLGGAFFVISHDLPGLAGSLAKLATDHEVPLDLGPTDAIGWPSAAPGVYIGPPVDATAAEPASGTATRTHGASSGHYAGRYGALALVAEVPLWADPRCADPSDAVPYPEMLLRAAADLRRDIQPLADSVARADPLLAARGPLYTGVTDTLAIAAAAAAMWERRASSGQVEGRLATVGEVTGIRNSVRRLPLRATGMLIRLLQAETADGSCRAVLGTELDAARDRFATMCSRAEAEIPVAPLPLRRLVSLQTGAGLTAAAHLA